MFETNILYYAYDNEDGDDFGVGYLDNKEAWVSRVNSWGRQDGARHDFTAESWDKVHQTNLRGCELAKVTPDNDGYLVTWADGDSENSMRINKKSEVSWVTNPKKVASVPRWVTRLKSAIREHKNQ